MRHMVFLAMLVMGIGASSSFADSGEEEPFSIQNLSKEETTAFVAGVAFAFAAADAQAKLVGRRPLYCYSAESTIGPQKLWDLLESELSGAFSQLQAAVGAAYLLSQRFPCSD